ncbi:MAG: class I SAM-dependent methyltransferase [Solirubrobacterales bacterium]|nr:class I SAM-dependent methyltransferase [Solirubrobacterales bacterium]
MSLFVKSAEMAYGEQAALAGVLAGLRPQLSLELGTFTGGSLVHIAAHSREVHSFDLASHRTETLPNVSYHLGDSRVTVPALLDRLTAERRSVDFVLVDADHSRAGVERDMINLLRSPALERTVLLVHDCANEGVREGVRNAILRAGDVAYADLSFVVATGASSLLAESWGGLGMVVVDRTGDLWKLDRGVLDNVHWPTGHRRSLAWRALRPARAVKRELMYQVRPAYRRIFGSRGEKLG